MHELIEQLKAALAKARAAAEKAETENRDFTAEERAQVSGFMAEAKELKAKIDQAKADGVADAAIREQIKSLGAGIELVTPTSRQVEAVSAGKGKSLGDRFIRSPQFKEWLARVAPGGHIAESTKGLTSPPVEFKTLITGVADDSAGALVMNDVQPGIIPLPARPLAMRDIVTHGTTTSDTVEYVQVLTQTNAAAPVAEATATAGVSGTKPESAMTFGRFTATVKTIAHWIPATKRALSDAGQLRTLIDAFLRDGLEQNLEDQMAAGNGIGENLMGLANIPNTQAQVWDTDILTTARKARTKVRTVGRAIANAFLLHPNDWERIDLLKDLDGRYIYGGPQGLGQPRLWGLPVAECEAIAEGTGYVGDFKKLVLFDREQASIQVSDSHQDFFIRNMVAILAEMRAAFVCLQPSAIVEVDLTAI